MPHAWIGIAHVSVSSMVFGMMALSFPFGATVFFGSDLGGSITSQYPLSYLDFVFGPALSMLPPAITIGDAFAVLWGGYLVLFAMAVMGPRKSLTRAMSLATSTGQEPHSNTMFAVLKWFAVLALCTAIIEQVLVYFGMRITPPALGNELLYFFSATVSPVTEEIGFRVVLVGLPLLVIIGGRRGVWRFLWRPYEERVPAYRVLVVVVPVGIMFGMAHVLPDDSWSAGKVVQATASGIILGWVYYRYGLAAAVLLHWAANYFVLSFVYFVAVLNRTGVSEVLGHPTITAMEYILVISGALTVLLMASNLPGRRSPPSGPALSQGQGST